MLHAMFPSRIHGVKFSKTFIKRSQYYRIKTDMRLQLTCITKQRQSRHRGQSAL